MPAFCLLVPVLQIPEYNPRRFCDHTCSLGRGIIFVGLEAWTAQHDFAWASLFNFKQWKVNNHGEEDTETQDLHRLSILGWIWVVKAKAIEESSNSGSFVTCYPVLSAPSTIL